MLMNINCYSAPDTVHTSPFIRKDRNTIAYNKEEIALLTPVPKG